MVGWMPPWVRDDEPTISVGGTREEQEDAGRRVGSVGARRTDRPTMPRFTTGAAGSAERQQLEQQLREAGVDEATIQTTLQAFDAQGQVFGFSAIRQQLFPTTGGGIPPVAQEEGGLARFLPSTRAPGAYTDPATGAIQMDNGVIIDPTKDALTGVFIDPSSDVPGSFKWLNSAASWNQNQVETWRGRLNKLGYGIAEKGGFDEELRNALDLYHKRKYFYGKSLSLGQESQQSVEEEAKEAYDPVLIRQDVRSTYREVFQEDPTDEELKRWERMVRRNVERVIAKGGSPQHAQLRAQEKFADKFLGTPQAKFEVESREENEDLKNSLIQAAQSTDFLAFGR